MRGTIFLFGLCLFALPGATRLAHAGEVYRCAGADDLVAYQDKPCARGQRQRVMQLDNAPTFSSVPAYDTSVAVPPAAATAAPPPPAPAATPLPAMYACVRYDGQRRYLSDTIPPPYAVPMGALGAPGQSLDRAYGGRDRLGMSAPGEVRPPKVGGPLLANAMVEVRDRCVPATHQQVCDELKRRYDANHEKLRMAFPSDQPPLEQREARLRAQISGC